MHQRFFLSIPLLLLVLSPLSAVAHNGAVAVAVPLQGIEIDGALSDWPSVMRRYPILLPEYGDTPKDSADFKASFRLGYSAAENVLWVAVEIEDESFVLAPTGGSWNNQDGCEVHVDLAHQEQDSPAVQVALFGQERFVFRPGADQGLEVEMRQEGNKRCYEWRIEAGRMRLQAGQVVGLDVVVEDQDQDGSFSWMAWGREIVKATSPERRGDALLVGEESQLGRLRAKVRWTDMDEGIGHTRVRVQSLNAPQLWLQAEMNQRGVYEIELPEGRYRAGVVGRAAKEQTFAVQPRIATQIALGVDPLQGKVQPAGPGKGRWQRFGLAEGLPSTYINAILQDRQGDLWFGTFSGVSRYDGKEFQTLTTQDGLANNAVGAILEDREGNLWFGTAGGVSRYEGKHFQSFTTQDGLANNDVRAILQDQQGDLWFGTAGGVSRYDGHQFQNFTTQDGLVNNDVRAMLEDQEGNLWFGTLGGGVSRYGGYHLKTFTTNDSLPTDRVNHLLEDREGNLWFSVEDQGVCRFDGRSFTRFRAEDGLASDQVWSIAQDREGKLFFGTNRGLSQYDGQHFITFTTAEGLVHNGISSLAQDAEGRLWPGTGGGVVQYDGKVFQGLRGRDGLPSEAVYQVLPSRTGEVWIATQEGLSRYRPGRVAPAIQFTGVVADRRMGPVEELSLPSSQEFLAFEFQGRSLSTRPEGMAYVYRLAGYDADWHPAYTNRVEYADLPRGEYTFEVKAVDRDLNYSAPATVKVTVHLPYGQLALYSLLGVLGLAVVWQAGRLVQRNQKLREANTAMSSANKELFSVNRQLGQTLEEKEKAQEALVRSESMAAIGTLVAGVAHELNNPLGAAYSLVQTVQEMVEEDTAEQLQQEKAEIVGHLAFSRKELNRAKEIVAALLGLSRQNQDYTEAVELNTVVQDALRVLYNQYKKYEVNITEEYAEGLPSVQRNFAQLGQVCMNLIKNAIEALKGVEGQIVLKTYAVDGQVVFECADTGPGIPEEVRQNIFKPFFTTKAPGEGTGLGLYICHQTIEKHRGSIEVESEVGKGTRFKVRLPAGDR